MRVGVHDGSDQALERLAVVAQQVGRAVDDEGRRDQGKPGEGAVGGHSPGLGHAPLVTLGRAWRDRPPRCGTRRRRPRRSPRAGPRSAAWSRAARPAWSAAGPAGATPPTPTVSGPAQAPRPTSSTPPTHSKPSLRSRRSSPRPGEQITAARGGSIRWGRDGGGRRAERTCPAVAGDEGGRAQPVPGDLGPRVRGGGGHRRRATGSDGSPTGASWASSSPATTCGASASARASGGTEPSPQTFPGFRTPST